MLSEGDEAPDFAVETTQGSFRLSDVEGPTVVFFFPKAGSRVCTAEACGFRDNLQSFEDVGATVLGVSTNDDLESLREFAGDKDLSYPLASGVDGKVADRFGLSGLLGLTHRAKRATFVLEDGEVVDRVKGLLSADKHVERSLEAIEADR